MHDSRVESRRLLSVFELLGALSTGGQPEKGRRNLKRYLDTFDELRDTHVQLMFVAAQVGDFPGLRSFRDALRKRERRCIKCTAGEIRRIKVGSLRRSIRAMEEELRSPPRGASRTQLRPSRLVRVLQQAFTRVERQHRRVAPDDTASIHRVRIAFKRFRYMIEAVAPLLPGASQRHLERLRKFQSLMGEIQDTEVLLATVERFQNNGKLDSLIAAAFRVQLLHRRRRFIGAYLKQAGHLRKFWPLPD
ncbi:MAG: CHAD domain-containing protein [Verrucomicrobia bacterium]|nr:CHAD domain-containing protein [Verrucomicrobiota bacterium]